MIEIEIADSWIVVMAIGLIADAVGVIFLSNSLMEFRKSKLDKVKEDLRHSKAKLTKYDKWYAEHQNEFMSEHEKSKAGTGVSVRDISTALHYAMQNRSNISLLGTWFWQLQSKIDENTILRLNSDAKVKKDAIIGVVLMLVGFALQVVSNALVFVFQ